MRKITIKRIYLTTAFMLILGLGIQPALSSGVSASASSRTTANSETPADTENGSPEGGQAPILKPQGVTSRNPATSPNNPDVSSGAKEGLSSTIGASDKTPADLPIRSFLATPSK